MAAKIIPKTPHYYDIASLNKLMSAQQLVIIESKNTI